MGQHRTNPVAIANRVPQQQVNAMPLGEDTALIGVHLIPAWDTEKDELVVFLNVVGGVMSPIMGGILPRNIKLCEVARAPLSKLRAALRGAPSPSVEPPAGLAAVETPEGTAPDEPSKLVLVTS